MKQQQHSSSSSSPIPRHILKPNHNNIILATSFSSFNNNHDKFTIPSQYLNHSVSSSSSLDTGDKRNSLGNKSKHLPGRSEVVEVGGRILGSDRKGFFDHLKPRSFLLSVSSTSIPK